MGVLGRRSAWFVAIVVVPMAAGGAPASETPGLRTFGPAGEARP